MKKGINTNKTSNAGTKSVSSCAFYLMAGLGKSGARKSGLAPVTTVHNWVVVSEFPLCIYIYAYIYFLLVSNQLMFWADIEGIQVTVLFTFNWKMWLESQRRRGLKEQEAQCNFTRTPLKSATVSPRTLGVCWGAFQMRKLPVSEEFLPSRQDARHCFKVRQCYVLLIRWACSNYMPPWLLFCRLIRTIFKTFVDHSSWTLLYVSKSSMIYPWNYWLGMASFFQWMFSLAYNFN